MIEEMFDVAINILTREGQYPAGTGVKKKLYPFNKIW